MENETKQILELILDRLGSMEERFTGIEERFVGLEKRFDGMEERFTGMEVRQGEIFEVVKAIEHSNHAHKAEIDSLTYKVANVEGTVNGVGEFIEKRKVV